MPNNKDNPQGGSKSSMGTHESDREFESQGQNKGHGKDSGQGQQAGGTGKGSPGPMDDDEMDTAGGRQGQFSDKNRGSEGQWSPGSTQESDS